MARSHYVYFFSVRGKLRHSDAGVRDRQVCPVERQLLAFARVLAFSPDILVLDEATANIDSVSERVIQKTTEIATKGRTSLIIAHRLSTVLHCDLIVVHRP